MNSSQDYRTTATGAIDYAHYTRAAMAIRQQDARAMFGRIGTIWRKITDLMGGGHNAPASKPKRLSTTR
ncbi:hypothetical protein [Thioclava pacifica]|uniref:Uncharacterized protein n=1 Tax=Thioclava pacifica DSM 10166 TaxID=1353537 RepID=A0A074JHU7_9RHOB|nr:hypothetical protein [Thioclava pacifica]KEO55133.1 hypothetical protein TP2_16270 [Thioclava pacifica DSM 10166]